MSTHDEFATWDAAYVLGALSPADRRTFEEHLRGCERCADAVGELAGLPGLLGRVPRESALALIEPGTADPGTADPGTVSADTSGPGLVAAEAAGVDTVGADTAGADTAGRGGHAAPTTAPDAAAASGAVGPSPDSLPSLLHRARRRRLRSRWLVGGLSAAAAALLVAAGAFVLPSVLNPAAAPQASVAMEQVEPSPLSADLRLTAEPWGTRIDSTCRYARVGSAGGGHAWDYAMVVTDRSGGQHTVSTWTAAEGTTARPAATTSVPLTDIAAVDIRAATDGTVLLRSTFP